jgi:hypothetical protein
MYRVIFREFRSHQAVQALSAHIGSGNRVEIDWALRALSYLAEHCPDRLRMCLPSFRHWLDFVFSFNYHQLKTIWKIISKLGVGTPATVLQSQYANETSQVDGTERTSAGWIWVYIRKGLQSSEVFAQRSGVLGAVALLSELLPLRVDETLLNASNGRSHENEEENNEIRNGSFFLSFACFFQLKRVCESITIHPCSKMQTRCLEMFWKRAEAIYL